MKKEKHSIRKGIKDAFIPSFRNAKDVNGNWDKKRLFAAILSYFLFLAMLFGFITAQDLIELLKLTFSLF